jgi:hypothetical protein
MNKIFDLIQTPEFWVITVFLQILINVVSNAISQAVPKPSLFWLDIMVYSYFSISVVAILFSYFQGYVSPFDSPYNGPWPKTMHSISYIDGGILAALVPVFLIIFPFKSRSIHIAVGALTIIFLSFAYAMVTKEHGFSNLAFIGYEIGTLVLAYMAGLYTILVLSVRYILKLFGESTALS